MKDHPMSDETQAVAVREEASVRITPGTALAAAIELAQNPDTRIEVITGLFDLQRRLESDQEERALADAVQAIQAEIPPVRKDGTIPKGGKSIPFATFEQEMAALQPYLNQHRIALTFSADFQATKFIVTCTARRGKATISATVPLPIDEGAGRNTTQAHGSSMSYGKRYAVEALFNIIRIGADDDGTTAHLKLMAEEQATILADLLKAGGGSEPALLTHFYADKYHSLDEVPAGDFIKLKGAIEDRNRAAAAKRAKEG